MEVAGIVVAGVQNCSKELNSVISRLPLGGFHNVLSTGRRRRRTRTRRIHHGYGAQGFGFQAVDFCDSSSAARWKKNAGVLADGNGRSYGRCQATKKGHGRRGVVQQQKSPETGDDGKSKPKEKQGSKYKEETRKSLVGFAGLASLKAQLYPQASVSSRTTMKTAEQEHVASTTFDRKAPKSVPSSNVSKTVASKPSGIIQARQSNHRVATEGGSPTASKADDNQSSFKKGKKASVVTTRTGEAFATERGGATAAAMEKRRKTLSERGAYGAGSGEYESRGSSKGAAILAAMQKAAALDRAKAAHRRKTVGDNLQYKMDGRGKEEALEEEAPPKPIVLKLEWNDQIQSLENLLRDLKQARYD